MSRFTAPLVVTPTEDYKRWKVLWSSTADALKIDCDLPVVKGGAARFAFDLGDEGSGVTIMPPIEFETDFASIPAFARGLLKTWGRYTNAAVIHDYLYRKGKIEVDETVHGVPEARLSPPFRLPYPTRKQADQIMLEAMKVLEVKKWRRTLIYAGIRVGGGRAWARNRR